MAKKETTKKTTKKAAKKLEEQAPIEVQEFEEAAALEVVEPQEEVVPLTTLDEEIEGVDEAKLNEMRREYGVKEEVEVMNGDPAVVTPVEEPEPLVEESVTEEVIPTEEVDEPAPKEQIKPKKSVFKRMFGYIWNGQEMDY